MGSIIIAYTLWILSTSSNMKKMFQEPLPVTYVLLSLGVLFFTNGLLGWMGSYRRGGFMLKMFLFLSVLTIGVEIGGIISLSILKTEVVDITARGWNETNQVTRNVIQEQLQCCGWNGPRDFMYGKRIVDSCYVVSAPSNLSSLMPIERVGLEGVPQSDHRRLSDVGCKDVLIDWMQKNKLILIASFGGLLLIQVFTVLLTVSVVNRKSTRSSSMESLDDPQTTYM